MIATTRTYCKICGLTNLEDARWAQRCGADMLGFIMVPATPRYVEPERVHEMATALTATDDGADPPGGAPPRLVGVMAGDDLVAAGEVARRCGLHLLQWHGPAAADQIAACALPVILAHRVAERIPWEEMALLDVWAYLLDSYAPNKLGGTGCSWRWELLHRGEPDTLRVILAGGLDPRNVGRAIRLARPWGVDVSSGVEARPGRKDPARVQQFVHSVRAAQSAEEETR